MDAELKDRLAIREQWRKRFRMPRRAAVKLSPEQAAQLLALRDHEGTCLLLPNGRAMYFFRDDSLPSLPLWCAPRWTEFSAPEAPAIRVTVMPAIRVTAILVILAMFLAL